MRLALLAFCIGLANGAIAVFLGVGGGLLTVPAFVTSLGLPQKVAVAMGVKLWFTESPEKKSLAPEETSGTSSASISEHRD